MSVHDALPGDLYADKAGKLWRVMWVCQQPTVGMVDVEPSLEPITAPVDAAYEGFRVGLSLPQPAPKSQQLQGGVSGLMWHGFKRIWRHDPPSGA